MTNKEIRRRVMTDMKIRTMMWECVAAELGVTQRQLNRAVLPLVIKSYVRYWILLPYRRGKRATLKIIGLFKRKKTRWTVCFADELTGSRILLGIFKSNQAASKDVSKRLAAEIERDLISQRTKEALQRRKAAGIKLGRPFGCKNKHHKFDRIGMPILRGLQRGQSKASLARRHKTSAVSINNWLRDNGYESYIATPIPLKKSAGGWDQRI